MIRIAAVGDVHFASDLAGSMRSSLARIGEDADLLLLAGDLTRSGDPSEGRALAAELEGTSVPVVAVLGNHDYHQDASDEIADVLSSAGVHILEGTAATFDMDGVTVGVAGSKGFGGGFAGACATDFGEPEMKRFIRHTKKVASELQLALRSLTSDVRLVLLHFSPIKGTLLGERLEIYPFLGSYLLAEAIDSEGADLVFHGHAHGGTEHGVTPGGIHVRNVAQPVIKHPYNLYCLDPHGVSAGNRLRQAAVVGGSGSGAEPQSSMRDS